jgi:hypothetical protein
MSIQVTTLPFVIPTAAEGSAVRLPLTRMTIQATTPLCQPDRSAA